MQFMYREWRRRVIRDARTRFFLSFRFVHIRLGRGHAGNDSYYEWNGWALGCFCSCSLLSMTVEGAAMYPTPEETVVVQAAEKLMIETMKRYDPSHDAYHGKLTDSQQTYFYIFIIIILDPF